MSSAHQAMLLSAAESKVYAKWDTSFASTGIAFSGGDLVVTSSTASTRTQRTNISKSSGKWYWEITVTNGPVFMAGGTGNSSVSATIYPGSNANGKGYVTDGGSYYNGSYSSFGGASYTTGDIIGCALDASTGNITFYKNNVLQGSMTDAVSGPYYAMVATANASAVLTANFGASAMAYTAPSGYNQGLYQ